MSVSHQLLQIQGRYARYWIGGTGQTLVLLHGPYGDVRQQWGRLLEQLAADYQVIAPELPGFGVSDPLALPTYQSFLSWLNLFFELLNIGGPIVLMGHSFGATLARLYTAENTSYVSKLILIDGGHVAEANGCARLIFRTPLVAALLFWLVRRSMSAHSRLRAIVHDERWLTSDFVAAARKAARGYAAVQRATGLINAPSFITPTCPTLVIWGEFDRIQPIEIGRHIAAQLPNAVFRAIANAGHLPQIEQAADFYAQISPFLRGHTDGRPPLP